MTTAGEGERVPPDGPRRVLVTGAAGFIGSTLVERMLALSSLENRSMLEKKESLDFRAVVNTVLESQQPAVEKKNLAVVNTLAPGLTIRGDRFLLHQAIANLLQNSIDFSFTCGRIELSAHVKDQMLCFRVDDNGASIPSYAEQKVFDKFFSLERPESAKKSTGLGLNFVKEVAILHGGDIVLENRDTKGVRASLTLPIL